MIWDMIHAYHKNSERYRTQEYLNFLYNADCVFGFGFASVEPDIIPPMILELTREREMWRKAKDWKKADEARQKICDMGYVIEDMPHGPRVKRLLLDSLMS